MGYVYLLKNIKTKFKTMKPGNTELLKDNKIIRFK